VFLNPELRRNIWLEFSIHRIIITPVTIGLILYLVYLTSNATKSAEIAFDIACFFIFLWGTKNASETVINEVNGSTWDFQRQSAISPWSMTWGKLLGGTLFSWYGAAICLIVYYVLHAHDAMHGILFQIPNELTPEQEILLLVAGGLFGQAIALLSSLQVLPQIRREKTNKTFRYFIVGAISGIFITSYSFQAVKAAGVQVKWYGFHFAMGNFALTTLVIFLGWAIVGLQRSFCKELQYRNIPWMWLLFNIFCMVYFSGLVSIDKLDIQASLSEIKDIQLLIQQAPLYIAFFIADMLTYLALLSDDLNVVRYKKLITRFQERNYREMLQQFPWWPISYVLAIVVGINTYFNQKIYSQLFENFSPAVFIITNILFMFRDILLIHYFFFDKNPKRNVGTIVVYLLILYVLVPMILQALHLYDWTALFIPSWGKNTTIAVISALVQIVLLAGMCRQRWQKAWATA